MSAHRFNQDVYVNGSKGIWTKGDGVYWCGHCGHEWDAEPIYRWWPIRLAWVTRSSFGVHGIESLKCDGIERPYVARVLSIWRLRVVIGEAT